MRRTGDYGKNQGAIYGGSYFNQLKALEITLYGGKNPRTGYVLCPSHDDLSTFSSYDEVEDAYKKQVDYSTRQDVILENIVDLFFEELIPDPFLYSLTSDCIQRGKTIKRRGNIRWVCFYPFSSSFSKSWFFDKYFFLVYYIQYVVYNAHV